MQASDFNGINIPLKSDKNNGTLQRDVYGNISLNSSKNEKDLRKI